MADDDSVAKEQCAVNLLSQEAGHEGGNFGRPDDAAFMRLALDEARKAFAEREVPVGAVLVKEGQVIVRAYNRREQSSDATAHAEILILREGGQRLKSWRLDGCTLYVTLEPCPMCAGALVLARVERIVFGAHDPKAGAAGSLFNIVQDSRLNHQMEVTSGVMAKECGGLLQEFFRQCRESVVK